MFSAGEVSGDLHGARLAQAILAQAPEMELVGFGGREMAQAGVTLAGPVALLKRAPKVPETNVYDVVVIGAGDRAEIWDAETWNRYAEEQESDFSDMDGEFTAFTGT